MKHPHRAASIAPDEAGPAQFDIEARHEEPLRLTAAQIRQPESLVDDQMYKVNLEELRLVTRQCVDEQFRKLISQLLSARSV